MYTKRKYLKSGCTLKNVKHAILIREFGKCQKKFNIQDHEILAYQVQK